MIAFCPFMQESEGSGSMASNGKVADPRVDLAGAGAMSIGDMFTKQTKRTSRSVMAALVDVGAKKQKATIPGAADVSAAVPRVDATTFALEAARHGKSKLF